MDFAKIMLEQAMRSSSERGQAVFDFALLALRSLLIANGGALIGLVTFLGHFQDAVRAIGAWLAFGAFSLGVFFGLLAIMFSYLAQGFFFDAEMSAARREAYESFRFDTSQMREAEGENAIKGAHRRVVAIVCGIVAASLFLVGCGLILWALIDAPRLEG